MWIPRSLHIGPDIGFDITNIGPDVSQSGLHIGSDIGPAVTDLGPDARLVSHTTLALAYIGPFCEPWPSPPPDFVDLRQSLADIGWFLADIG